MTTDNTQTERCRRCMAQSPIIACVNKAAEDCLIHNTQTEGERRKWEKPYADWKRIADETPDYDCWPAPIRGWEVIALVNRITALESAASRGDRAVEALRRIAVTEIEDSPYPLYAAAGAHATAVFIATEALDDFEREKGGGSGT